MSNKAYTEIVNWSVGDVGINDQKDKVVRLVGGAMFISVCGVTSVCGVESLKGLTALKDDSLIYEHGKVSAVPTYVTSWNVGDCGIDLNGKYWCRLSVGALTESEYTGQITYYTTSEIRNVKAMKNKNMKLELNWVM